MGTNLSTVSYKHHQAKRLAESVANTESYYLFVSDFLNHSNNQLQPIVDNNSNTYVFPYSNMILGKYINVTDLAYGIAYNPWVSNTTYAMYDDQSATLATDAFFAITNEGSFYHYWKVLDNNNGNPSTIQPLIAYVSGSNTVSFRTSDGYRWKYMSSVSSSIASKFKVGNTLFPVVANTSVSAAAVPGSIDIITIDFNDGGRGYNNYTNGVLRSTDIYPSGNRLQFNISNTQINTTNGYYTGCLFLMTSGLSKGQYKTITNYVSNSSGSIIQLDSQLLYDPTNGDTFDINPQVQVIGDGQQTINCVARALINSLASNATYRIEVLQPGAGYRWANATVVANSIVGIANTATVRPILPPRGGHGNSVFKELYSHSLILTSYLIGTESGVIPDVNQFQQYGIIKDPLFANVQIVMSTLTGTFVPGECVYQLIPLKIAANASVVISNNQLNCNTADFLTQILPGQKVYVSSQDNLFAQLLTINNVINTTSLYTTANVNFSCTSVNIYTANIVSNCYVISVPGAANTINFANVSPKVQSISSILFGNTSGARGILLNTTVSGVAKTLNTFIQLYKYVATIVNGSFIQGETLVQGNNTGYLHSVSGSGTVTLLASGQTFTANGGNIVGQTSGAIATPTTIYPPELVYETGEVEYIENISPVLRQGGMTETIQLVLNY